MIYKDEPHLYIFTGHFGSGKTEVSVNFAMDLKKQKPDAKVYLVDMDIINPFFRSADAKEALEKAGIIVETMLYANTNVDAPALTGKMGYIIEDRSAYVILDIGGDDLGARACGYYAGLIASRPHTIYFVMNPYRPFTCDSDQAKVIFSEIEGSAGVKIDEILDNTNVLDYTDGDSITEGGKKVDEFAEIIGLPIGCHAVMAKCPEAERRARELYKDSELLIMDEYVKLLFDRV